MTTTRWSLWDGVQTLPKPSTPSLTKDGASVTALFTLTLIDQIKPVEEQPNSTAEAR
jgi:hypothetical protein